MQYEKSFKEEAVKLSDEIGVKAAAAQLGIPYYTLSGWRNDRKNTVPTLMSEADISVCLRIQSSNVSSNLKKKMLS